MTEVLAWSPDMLRTGEVSASKLLETCLARIEALNASLGAFITVTADEAHAQARAADAAFADGRLLGPLHGLPIVIKDNIDTAGVRTTVGSRFFQDTVPARDAAAVARLREAGAVLVGKTLLHEFAFGGTTQNPHYGSCRNPWDTTRIPGGSSGGSAVAVATGMCFAALGTDTGGSVRLPAALTGACGLRPTQGLVSNRGVFPTTWSFDTVGPIAKTVIDLALILQVMAGFDHDDPGSIPSDPVSYNESLERDIRGIRVGVPTSFYFEEIDPEITERVTDALDLLSQLGAQIVEVKLPGAAEARDLTSLMLGTEAYAIHRGRLETQSDLFGDDVRRRLLLFQGVTGAEYAVALQQSRVWRRTLEDVFGRVDTVISPAFGVVAPRIEDAEMVETTRRLTRLTFGWTLAGVPALAVPCGFSETGLPIAMQLAAAPWQEAVLLRLGAAYQRATTWHLQEPEGRMTF